MGVDGDLEQRYWPLVVTACEWRAFGVEDPEVIAGRVFADVEPRSVVGLATLFKAIDQEVARAYQNSAPSAGSGPLGLPATWLAFAPADRRPRALVALSDLPDRERRILQLAYWDELTRIEISEVLKVDLVVVARRLDKAFDRFRSRLAKREPGVSHEDLVAVLKDLKPGPHHRSPSPYS
ncbi:MAG TPA: sigma factor-like helix-turn-helix DNA-binding protein [Propionibacteriaceae bacterium]|nr:sigma factor-like helix-turn-helix DNA-binding protein [Propionibacteriaceae bacterium]